MLNFKILWKSCVSKKFLKNKLGEVMIFYVESVEEIILQIISEEDLELSI